jgi:glycosyltransferase involved in cell wall biosynthesis
MHIVHILRGKANPNTQNGVNKIVDALANTQTQLGNTVHVFAVASNTEQRHSPSYRYTLLKEPIFSPLPSIRLLFELNKIDKSAIIHVHSVFISWYPILLLFLKLKGFRKIVLTPHGGYSVFNINKNIFKKIYFLTIEKIVLFSVSKIHFSDRHEFNDLFRRHARKAIYIPNGIELLRNKPLISNSNGLIFGFMGRLKADHKGLDLLLTGFAKYKKCNGKGVLVLIGDGPDRKFLENLTTTLNISTSVYFKGHLFGEKRIETLQTMSAFIHTSRWEGMPISCLEAAGLGLPLLITRETNISNYVENFNCGLIISPNDPDTISQNLLKFDEIYDDPDRYNFISHNSVKLIQTELNWNNITSKILKDLYEKD